MKHDFLRNLSSWFVIPVSLLHPTFLPFTHAWIILGFAFKRFLSLSLIVIVASSRSWKDNYNEKCFFFLLYYINVFLSGLNNGFFFFMILVLIILVVSGRKFFNATRGISLKRDMDKQVEPSLREIMNTETWIRLLEREEEKSY